MHSAALDSSGSPKKRTISRGLSEDESLRSVIKETESSSRRLTRSDSRVGALKKRTESQSDQDLYMGLPEMLELQANYEEVVQELRGLEVERETLLFQVDVLQDTLEGVEELLAETQREAGEASVELGREREAKRKLERTVCSLMQEVERLKEENNNKASATVNTSGSVDEVTTQGHQIKNDAKALVKDSLLCEPQSGESRASEKEGQNEGEEDDGSLLTKLKKMVTKPLGHMPSLAVVDPSSAHGILLRPYGNDVKDGRDPSPDRNDSDSISAYEDAFAETPEQDRMFPGEGDTLELPDDSEKTTNNCLVNDENNQDPKNPDACVVS
ncbi:leucine-rich repeat flightless-interacting protein 1 isoform X2 [Anoplopoma fimbria]|uniref:leucine-rich repeat flightless-interacting protein 1 isoform X2 n=1 Tax=Anoplopoma fimbria TaxID=229290 RepID=UPI0023EC604C|nr:leucine-rich repeat flightless-interacting protein 1 isoform X2 [Anoplopoma fimbria]